MASTWHESDEIAAAEPVAPVTPPTPRRAERRYMRQTTGAGVRGVQDLVSRYAEQQRQQQASGQQQADQKQAGQKPVGQQTGGQHRTGGQHQRLDGQQSLPTRKPSRR
jgi:hypothetical protein